MLERKVVWGHANWTSWPGRQQRCNHFAMKCRSQVAISFANASFYNFLSYSFNVSKSMLDFFVCAKEWSSATAGDRFSALAQWPQNFSELFCMEKGQISILPRDHLASPAYIVNEVGLPTKRYQMSSTYFLKSNGHFWP